MTLTRRKVDRLESRARDRIRPFEKAGDSMRRRIDVWARRDEVLKAIEP